MANDPISLEAQARAVAMAASRLRSGNPALKEAEKTLRLLDRLATLIRERPHDEEASDELTTHLLAILRLSDEAEGSS